MIEGKGKFLNRRTKTANSEYDKFFIYVPAEVARDGTFPFKASEPVMVKIDSQRKRLVIEKIEVARTSKKKGGREEEKIEYVDADTGKPWSAQ